MLCTPRSIRDNALVWDGLVRCLQSTEWEPEIAIVGDSHAEHLFLGIAEAAVNRSVVYYVQASTPVIADEKFRDIFAFLLGSSSLHTVILANSWKSRADLATLERALLETTRALGRARKRVFLAEDVPTFGFDPRSCKLSGRFGLESRCTEERVTGFPHHQRMREVLERVARADGGASVLRLVDYFCEPALCSMARGENLLYRDSNHLNILGSRYVGERLLADHPEIATIARAARRAE